jgi:hypothetical protein
MKFSWGKMMEIFTSRPDLFLKIEEDDPASLALSAAARCRRPAGAFLSDGGRVSVYDGRGVLVLRRQLDDEVELVDGLAILRYIIGRAVVAKSPSYVLVLFCEGLA